jgi:two-component sensor histidine kinase
LAARTHINPEAGNTLALALVASSHAPLLLLDGDLTVIAASVSFCREFQIAQPEIEGENLFRLGAGEWDSPQLRALMTAAGSGFVQLKVNEMDLHRGARQTRRLVLNAQKLDQEDEGKVRLLLTVTDVTDLRAGDKTKDDLLREKSILLQEVQHRVANSLQIIASVLMQTARRVQSEEARGHLESAHHRVMSVAALQRQLTVSTTSEVVLATYLVKLCESIAASMIPDPEQVSLTVDVDDASTTAEVSVSLGLIITELVINALKHAFPDYRKGQIVLSYKATGSNWTMAVTDNGVGVPTVLIPSRGGLGTSIVQALAGQLEARVQITAQKPGTRVAIIHD